MVIDFEKQREQEQQRINLDLIRLRLDGGLPSTRYDTYEEQRSVQLWTYKQVQARIAEDPGIELYDIVAEMMVAAVNFRDLSAFNPQVSWWYSIVETTLQDILDGILPFD